MNDILLKNNISKILNSLEKRLEFLFEHSIVLILMIFSFAVILRFLFFEAELLIRQDANAYFWYAMDMSIIKNIPPSFHANDGWPMFLSIFFGIFHFNNYHDYVMLQRIITILISSLTVFPIYFLSRKYFDKTFSILTTTLLVFEPHIVQNSLLGLTEPLYLFLSISSLSLFLSKNQKLWYCSFAIAALSTIVRAEGIIILVIFSIVFLLNYRKQKKTMKKIILGVLIFTSIFAPMMIIKIQTSTGLSNSSLNPIIGYSIGTVINPNDSGINFENFQKSIEIMIKRLGQSMIPYFAFFVPFGIVLLIKNKSFENDLIKIALILYSIVAIRIFFDVGDLRFIFFLYPLFAILSSYTVRYLIEQFELRRISIFLIITALILLSWFFLYSHNNYQYDIDVIKFSKYMINNVSVSNNFYPESGYIYGEWALMNLKFPILSKDAIYTGPELLDYVKGSDYVYLEQKAKSVKEYIMLARNQGLSHLVIDDNIKRPAYFTDVYYHEEKYPYLIKEFDSTKNGYKFYNVKVFKINYDYFESEIKN